MALPSRYRSRGLVDVRHLHCCSQRDSQPPWHGGGQPCLYCIVTKLNHSDAKSSGDGLQLELASDLRERRGRLRRLYESPAPSIRSRLAQLEVSTICSLNAWDAALTGQRGTYEL